MILISYFEKFVSNIQPSKERIEAISNAHTTLRKHLTDDADLKYEVESSFLTGSYARHTAIDPIKDADIILLLKEKKVSDDKTDPPPRDVLKDLKTAIDDFYENVNLETQRRSIQVFLEEDDIRMDVVPSVAPNGKENQLFVPDYEQSNWIDSNPFAHLTFATDKNKKSDGKFVRVAKAMKWWKSKNLTKDMAPKSFLLETIVADNIDANAKSVCEAFEGTLRNIVDSYGENRKNGTLPVINDPGLDSNDLAKSCGWTVDNFNYFFDEIEQILKTAQDANCSNTERDETIRLWKSIFGDEYPDALTEEEEKRFSTSGQTDVETKHQFPYTVKISASLHKSKGGVFLQNYPSNGFKIAKKLWIRFQIDDTTFPGSYQVKWSVINHGKDARLAGQLRRTSTGSAMTWERTEYRGHHFMDCELYSDGKIIAKTRYIVNII